MNQHITGASVLCDPSQGPCCTSSCGYHLGNIECSPPTECADISYCSGGSFECPDPTLKQDGTFCNNNTQVCSSGVSDVQQWGN